MLTETQLKKYADVLIWGMKTARTQNYRPNDIVLVRYNLAALRLAEILQERLLGLGLHPVVRLLATPAMERTFYKKANDRQLVFEAPGERQLYAGLNGSMFLYAPESLTHLQDIDSARIAKTMIARKPLKDILFKREEQGKLGWTLCTLPTAQIARHARLTLRQYTDQVVRACYLNARDPVRAWQEIYENARDIKGWLNGMKIKSYRIESKHIDLTVGHGERRRWIGISGHNIPSFELFISPDWRATEGVYYADQPSFRSGNLVKGVRLEFKKGTAVSIDARMNAGFVQKQLAMDRGASRIGEFSLTDTRFSKIDRFMADTLYDENYGGKFGNCHIAVGSSYSDTYAGKVKTLTARKKAALGFNDSALHWDLVNTEDKVVTATLAGGKKTVIYEKGKFTV